MGFKDTGIHLSKGVRSEKCTHVSLRQVHTEYFDKPNATAVECTQGKPGSTRAAP